MSENKPLDPNQEPDGGVEVPVTVRQRQVEAEIDLEKIQKKLKQDSEVLYREVTGAAREGGSALRSFFSNQFSQVGFLVEFWGDSIDDYGSKHEEFWKKYQQRKAAKGLEGLEVTTKRLRSQTFNTFEREMEFNYRDPVTVTVYFLPDGQDLYISWRSFIQQPVSESKVIAVAMLVVTFWLTFGNLGNIPTFDLGVFLLWLLIIGLATLVGWLVVFGAIFAWGYFRCEGDFLYLLRKPISEQHADDVKRLANAIHSSIIAAADEMGVDTAKLSAREQVKRKKSRSPI